MVSGAHEEIEDAVREADRIAMLLPEKEYVEVFFNGIKQYTAHGQMAILPKDAGLTSFSVRIDWINDGHVGITLFSGTQREDFEITRGNAGAVVLSHGEARDLIEALAADCEGRRKFFRVTTRISPDDAEEVAMARNVSGGRIDWR